MANKIDKIQGLRFLHNGSLEYRRGLFLIENKKILEISHVIVQDSKYFILCQEYKVNQFVAALNSIQIEKIEKSFQILNVLDINSEKSYNKIFCDEKLYMIAETLEVYNNL